MQIDGSGDREMNATWGGTEFFFRVARMLNFRTSVHPRWRPTLFYSTRVRHVRQGMRLAVGSKQFSRSKKMTFVQDVGPPSVPTMRV
jgi:hypothetical protein